MKQPHTRLYEDTLCCFRFTNKNSLHLSKIKKKMRPQASQATLQVFILYNSREEQTHKHEAGKCQRCRQKEKSHNCPLSEGCSPKWVAFNWATERYFCDSHSRRWGSALNDIHRRENVARCDQTIISGASSLIVSSEAEREAEEEMGQKRSVS